MSSVQIFGRPTGLAVATAVVLLALAVGAGEARGDSPRAVYAMTNTAAGNAVKVFDPAGDGTLTADGQVATGGAGSGVGLGSQGGLVLAGHRLLAVNAGSDSISSLRVEGDDLELVDTVGSGGDLPISLTVHDGLLYVLNAGGGANISGFEVSRRGRLSPLAGSTRPLSGGSPGPAQISFDPAGETLVVTEKDTNLIDTYAVDPDTGLVGTPNPQASVGATPFGFGFDKRGHLIVSEAFGGATDQSAVSSYGLDDGIIDPISSSVPTTETAACWIVVTKNGRFAYTTNTDSGSISGYRIGRDGTLSLLDGDGETGLTGPGPIDMGLSGNSRFLYSLNSGDGTISGFRVQADGGLGSIGGAGALPTTVSGLAAR